MIETLIVIAKRPEPGRSKTRLMPALTAGQAALAAAGALNDTLRTAAQVPSRHHLLAFSGSVSGWLPAGWLHCTQPSGGLDVRIAAAFAAAPPGPALLIGMDTPQVSLGQLSAFNHAEYAACLGMACDGGYWALGLRDPQIADQVLTGIPMSTSHTGIAQLRRMHDLGLDVQLLDEITDVDTIDDAHAVAAAIPFSSFASALSAVTLAPVEAAG